MLHINMELSDHEPDERILSRKANKPLMEKKRRARINRCLYEMKQMLVESAKNTSTSHSKWEKADILEMTVAYIKQLQMQLGKADASFHFPYIDGYSECMKEVQKFNSTSNVSVEVMQHNNKLHNHLNASLVALKQSAPRVDSNKKVHQRYLLNGVNHCNLQMQPAMATSIASDSNPETSSYVSDSLLKNAFRNLQRRRKSSSDLTNDNQVVPLPSTLLLPNRTIDAASPTGASTQISTVATTTENTSDPAIVARVIETSSNLLKSYSFPDRLPLLVNVPPYCMNNINFLTLSSLWNQSLWRPF